MNQPTGFGLVSAARLWVAAAAFWVIQSAELWSIGVRRKTLAQGEAEPDSGQRTGSS